MRKLTKPELACLLIADTHGEFRPTTFQQVKCCVALVGWGFMGEHDGSPGVFWNTAKGERALSDQLALVKA